MTSKRHHSIVFSANDEHPVTADLFHPVGPPVGGILVAPAMAVPAKFYRSFANYLSDRGYLVLVPSYRGVGEDLHRDPTLTHTRLSDWGEKDLQGALFELRNRLNGHPLFWVGHSVGSQLFGLVDTTTISKAVFVAGQNGHWRLWNGWRKAAMWGLWHTIPWLTKGFGRLPMATFGMGEDVPAAVGNQWAEWGRDPRYILKFADERPDIFTYQGAIRAYAIADDSYAPPQSVRKLLEAYPLAATETIEILPAHWNAKQIGHFGMFRTRFRDTFWDEVVQWFSED